MSQVEDRLQTLQDLLVKEFRACQSLFTTTQHERTALLAGDTGALTPILEAKEALLDELGRVGDERRKVVGQLAQETGLETPDVFALLPALQPEAADWLNRLCEGIAALASQARQLNNGNQALTRSALERIDAVQAFLLSQLLPQPGYQPPLGRAVQDPPAAVEVDQRA